MRRTGAASAAPRCVLLNFRKMSLFSGVQESLFVDVVDDLSSVYLCA